MTFFRNFDFMTTLIMFDVQQTIRSFTIPEQLLKWIILTYILCQISKRSFLFSVYIFYSVPFFSKFVPKTVHFSKIPSQLVSFKTPLSTNSTHRLFLPAKPFCISRIEIFEKKTNHISLEIYYSLHFTFFEMTE